MRRCLSSPSKYARGASLRIGRSAAIATLARFCGSAAIGRSRFATMTGLFAVTVSPYGVFATGKGKTLTRTADELAVKLDEPARGTDIGSGRRPRVIGDGGVGRVVDVVPSEGNVERVRDSEDKPG
jgi:hypothetical protein